MPVVAGLVAGSHSASSMCQWWRGRRPVSHRASAIADGAGDQFHIEPVQCVALLGWWLVAGFVECQFHIEPVQGTGAAWAGNWFHIVPVQCVPLQTGLVASFR